MTQKNKPSQTGTESIVRTQEFGAAPEEINVVEPALAVAVGTSTPAKAESPKKKVEVDADLLESLIKDIAELKGKQNEFEQTAPQDQLRKIEALRASGKLVKSVKVRRFEGVLVLGWKVVEDRVWVADGKLNEIQNIEVYAEDGKVLQTSLLQFGRSCLYEPYEVIKESKTADGSIEFVIILSDGKELTINSKYVN
jgi:hypothetical protein